VCATLAAAVFAIDVLTAVGLVDGVLYVIVVVAAARLTSIAITRGFALACTVLLSVGMLYSPASDLSQTEIWMTWLAVNCVLWAVTVFGVKLSLERDRAEQKWREAEDVNRHLACLARHDHLTKLPNRRYLDDQLTREHARAKRERIPLSLVLIDIDWFKAFNLDPAVGRARVCVCRADWLGARRPQGQPCNDERNRVRSVLTHWVMRKTSANVKVYGLLR
jgi:predicted signal transduction protein with EAL and GGDEF domain